MRAGTLVFDLDGTLWDTTAACVRGWNRVLDRLGLSSRRVCQDDIQRVTGRSHVEAVCTVFGDLGDAMVERISEETAVEDVAEIARTGGDLYPRVHELVPVLAAERPLMIVSNCQAGYVEVFLKTSGLASSFVDFECWGNTGRSKSDNLRAVLERNAVRDPIFVGDTEGDERAARDNGVPFVHATYGFGVAQAPDAHIDAFAELPRLLR